MYLKLSDSPLDVSTQLVIEDYERIAKSFHPSLKLSVSHIHLAKTGM